MTRALNTCGILGPAVLVVLIAFACVPRPLPVMTTFNAGALASVQTIATTETALSSTGWLTHTLVIRQRLRPAIEYGERSAIGLTQRRKADVL